MFPKGLRICLRLFNCSYTF